MPLIPKDLSPEVYRSLQQLEKQGFDARVSGSDIDRLKLLVRIKAGDPRFSWSNPAGAEGEGRPKTSPRGFSYNRLDDYFHLSSEVFCTHKDVSEFVLCFITPGGPGGLIVGPLSKPRQIASVPVKDLRSSSLDRAVMAAAMASRSYQEVASVLTPRTLAR